MRPTRDPLLLLACGGNAPPAVVALDLLPATVLPGDDFAVRAEVADPEGALDLVAGWVEIRSAEVARFENEGVAGTFVADVDGGKILAELDEGAEQSDVDVKVVFTDTAGNRGTRTGSLTVTCRGDDVRWCDGRCVDTSSDAEHCGECGEGCRAHELCFDGECLGGEGWTPCVEQYTDAIDCAATCAAFDLACGDGCDSDPVSDDDFVRYGRTEGACLGGDDSYSVRFDGDCQTQSEVSAPFYVSCCCRLP